MTYQSYYPTTMSDDFEPLSFTNISGGAAPILASVIVSTPDPRHMVLQPKGIYH